MKKANKIIVFLTILFLSVGLIIIKENFNLENNTYIVSESEVNDNEKLSSIKSEKDNNESSHIKEDDEENINKKMLIIYISGQVKNPGIVTIEHDKRLADAVEELGGVTLDADLNKINMASTLADGEHYIIPKLGEEILNENQINEEANFINSNQNINQSKKVNINIATIQELDTLPGVGEATANKIITYREENNIFKSIEEIKNVNGIGDKKYENIKDLISIN